MAGIDHGRQFVPLRIAVLTVSDTRTLETDKSVQDIEAPVAGILTQKVAAGEVYPVGTEIGEITPA